MAKRNKGSNPNIVDTQRQGITSLANAVASASNGRIPMGTSGYSLAQTPSSTDFRKGMVVPKKSGRSDAPDNAGTAVPRHGVPQRTMGPRFSISVALPGPQSPEANLTQGNGRIIPSAIRRSVASFAAGQSDYMG